MLAPLAHRVYRRLFLAHVAALFGSGLATIGLSLLAYDLAGGDAGVVLGTALTLKMIAYVGVAPIAGAVAHRLPRRRMLAALDLIRAGVAIGMLFADAAWQVYGLIFLLSLASAAFTPTLQATIPDLIEDEATYTQALSLSRLAYDLEALSSPLAAAALLSILAYDGLFALNALGFLISAALILSIAIPKARPPERSGGVIDALSFGLRLFLRTPRLAGLSALNVAAAAAGAMVIVNTVALARDRFGADETGTALFFAAAGAGSMLAALSLPRLLHRLPDRSVMLGGGALAFAALIIGLIADHQAIFFVIWFAIGAGASLITTPAGRVLRRSSAPGDRSAAFSAQFALSHLGWMIAYPTAGYVGAHWGLDGAMIALAAIAAVALLLAARLWPTNDREALTHTHAAVDHMHPHTHDAHHQHDHEGWEGPEPHVHPHRHAAHTHRHAYVVDLHHPRWPD